MGLEKNAIFLNGYLIQNLNAIEIEKPLQP